MIAQIPQNYGAALLERVPDLRVKMLKERKLIDEWYKDATWSFSRSGYPKNRLPSMQYD